MAHIIIVEDEPLLVKTLNLQLLSLGYQVRTATNGETALEMIREETPDLVLLDLLLPKVNGFDVLRIMKENPLLKHIPVIILSNLGQSEDIKRGLNLGAEDYFIKSDTDLSDVGEKIERVLSKTHA